MDGVKKIDIRADYTTFTKFYDEVLDRKGNDDGIRIEADPITGKQAFAYVDLNILGDIYGEFYGEPISSPKNKTMSPEFVARLLETAKKFLGVPYVYGQSSPSGCDCSGFVKLAFGELGVNLPHQSSSQGELGLPVSANELMKGDLLFFNTDTPKGERVNHVGIVLEVSASGIDMIHASSGRKMVLIDKNALKPGAYWDKAFLFARRLEV
jgi:cell wall-associated NlpC family hydrolase